MARREARAPRIVPGHLAAVDLVRLKNRLYDVINLDRDQVLFIPLCARCASAIEALGKPIERHDARDVVIVS
jgi:CRISPR-associated protein Cas2